MDTVFLLKDLLCFSIVGRKIMDTVFRLKCLLCFSDSLLLYANFGAVLHKGIALVSVERWHLSCLFVC
jgi:hypothetical protein